MLDRVGDPDVVEVQPNTGLGREQVGPAVGSAAAIDVACGFGEQVQYRVRVNLAHQGVGNRSDNECITAEP